MSFRKVEGALSRLIGRSDHTFPLFNFFFQADGERRISLRFISFLGKKRARRHEVIVKNNIRKPGSFQNNQESLQTAEWGTSSD